MWGKGFLTFPQPIFNFLTFWMCGIGCNEFPHTFPHTRPSRKIKRKIPYIFPMCGTLFSLHQFHTCGKFLTFSSLFPHIFLTLKFHSVSCPVTLFSFPCLFCQVFLRDRVHASTLKQTQKGKVNHVTSQESFFEATALLTRLGVLIFTVRQDGSRSRFFPQADAETDTNTDAKSLALYLKEKRKKQRRSYRLLRWCFRLHG